MTDDSTSRSAEGEESADDGRAPDADETPPGRRDGPPTEDEVEPGDPRSVPDEADPAGDGPTDESADPEPTPGVESDSETDDVTDESLSEAGYARLGDSGIASTMAGPAEEATANEEMDAEVMDAEEREAKETDVGGREAKEMDAEGIPESDATGTPGANPESTEEPTDLPGVSIESPADATDPSGGSPTEFVPEDVRKYERFKKMDGARYDRVNEFLRDRTYVTAREWAIARLCADFRTETGVEMTKIGDHLPELVPFMTDTYTPQAVNQARHSFEEKVRKSGATFLYGAMSGFFTAEQLDDVMYEITEVAKFLLEVEGVDLSVDEELEAEDRILSVMREVRQQSEQLRHEGVECPECGHEIGGDGERP